MSEQEKTVTEEAKQKQDAPKKSARAAFLIGFICNLIFWSGSKGKLLPAMRDHKTRKQQERNI